MCFQQHPDSHELESSSQPTTPSQPTPQPLLYQAQQHPGWRAEWGLYGPNPHSPSPTTVQPGAYPSFVPIPGTTQNKRPRRRYDEIERIYKCGWNGCENTVHSPT
ncbi:hypothetical protein FPQ18DRAFT_147019 [Pyronema domesticum]|nr:hypothetical protein FPQ18DRAFT_147019 [Pyronema domesticum]